MSVELTLETVSNTILDDLVGIGTGRAGFVCAVANTIAEVLVGTKASSIWHTILRGTAERCSLCKHALNAGSLFEQVSR